MTLRIFGINKATPDTKYFVGEIETPYDQAKHAGSVEQQAHIMDKIIKLMPDELLGDCMMFVEGTGYKYSFELLYARP